LGGGLAKSTSTGNVQSIDAKAKREDTLGSLANVLLGKLARLSAPRCLEDFRSAVWVGLLTGCHTELSSAIVGECLGCHGQFQEKLILAAS